LGTTRFGGVNATAARTLEKVAKNMTYEGKTEFVDEFNNIMGQLSADEKNEFSQLVGGLSSDPTNRGGWDKVADFLSG
jgi:hypothetical protein